MVQDLLNESLVFREVLILPAIKKEAHEPLLRRLTLGDSFHGGMAEATNAAPLTGDILISRSLQTQPDVPLLMGNR